MELTVENPSAPPARRRRSRWLTIGLPVVVVLVAGGIVAADVLTPGSVTGDLRPADQAAKAYATAIVSRHWQDVHDQLCAKDRATLTTEKLAARYGTPRRTAFTLTDVAVTQGVDGRYTAFADVEFTTADGTTTTHVPLVDDGSRWRPCP